MKIIQNINLIVVILLSCLNNNLVLAIDNLNRTTISVKKCCELNYTMKDGICINYGNSSELLVGVYEEEVQILVNINFVYNNATQCDNDTVTLQPNITSDEDFFVQNDGTLWLPTRGIFFESDEYCIEYFEDEGVSAIVCSSKFDPGIDPGLPAHIIGLFISLPFLLITFVVYALLPVRNLHAMCLMCFVFTLFWSFLLTALGYFFLDVANDDDSLLCQLQGKLTYFFFLSAMFWLNAISFNIWLTFSGIKGFSTKKNLPLRKRFLMYNVYSWGAPLFLILFYILLCYTVAPDAWYNPGVGCWIYVNVEQVIIFYGPIAMLVTANLIFFILTAWKIKQARKHASMFQSRGNKKHLKNEDKQTFYLYLKLIFGMGINWSVEVIIWILFLSGTEIPYVVMNIASICDAIYGVFIFFTFVFRRSVWNSLKMRYYMIRQKNEDRCQVQNDIYIKAGCMLDEPLRNEAHQTIAES